MVINIKKKKYLYLCEK